MNTKVLYITHDGLLDPLGQSQILPYLIGLSKNYEIAILSFEKEEKLGSKDFIRLKATLKDHHIFHKKLVFRKKLLLPLQIIKGVITASRLIKKNKIDFIHSRSFVATIIAFLTKKMLKTPYIFDMRGFWVEERIELGVLGTGLVYKLFKKLEKSMMNGASQIVVLTNEMKQELIGSYKINTQISIIPTCADTEKFVFKKKNYQKLKFIYFGSCGPRYDLYKTIKFFEALNFFLNVELTLLINNPEELNNKLKKLISSNKKIKLIKKQIRNNVPELLNKHNFAIFFLKVPLSGKGVCPTRFAESLACGLPVITNSGIGDCDKIIEKNKVGFIFDKITEENIKKIDKLIKDPSLPERCRIIAKKYFDLNTGLKKYSQIYDNAKK